MRPRKQQGYIALSLLLIVVVGISTFALSSFNNATRPPAEVVKRQQILAALEKAKAELLAYAANTHVIHGDRGPGYFPAAGGSAPCASKEGLLPTQVCDAQNKVLYQFSTPNETAPDSFGYKVAATLVYPAGGDAIDRTQPSGFLPLADAEGVAALLTYPDTGITLDEISLPIRHEEVMTAIAPIIAHHVGRVLTAYQLQYGGGGFPESIEDLLEALDLAPAAERGSSPRGGPSSNGWDNREEPGYTRGKHWPIPFRLDVTDFVPAWFLEENWLGTLTHYGQNRSAGTVSFTIAGCQGMRFVMRLQDDAIGRIGSRCGS